MAENGEKSEVAKREEEILAFWEHEKVFEKSLTKRAPKGEFVFYDGPPGANGKPGMHHLESRAYKDVILRYKTMRGYRVPRKAGWDTHGLPVELAVEKDLGFSGKQDIEKYGISAFNRKCRESVYRYIDLWEKATKRLGYSVDLTHAYATLDPSYMERLWGVVAKVYRDGRLYKDYKIVPWCPRCGTSLSSHELALGYDEVKDLTITAQFELVDEPGTFLLAWTTTPWTLPGNVALAINKDVRYAKYQGEHARVIVAEDMAAKVLGDNWVNVAYINGTDLLGRHYKPLYGFARELAPESERAKFENAYQVYHADFVTTEDGTGIVHTAVMYGADDFDLGTKIGLPKLHLVSPEGRFVAGTGFLENRSVVEEETAVELLKDLQARGLLFKKESYTHTYPFCWRCKTRLIYYARDSWYIRMDDLRNTLVAENKKILWEPAHIREGRMGEWLAGVKDWAISRERYWGTPLPVWETAGGEKRVVIGSLRELKQRAKKSGNRYFVMRHGEAGHNVAGMANNDQEGNGLTDIGKDQVRSALRAVPRVSKIYASPLMRTRETAEIAAKAQGLSMSAITYDGRLREFDFGDLNHRPIAEFQAYRDAHPYDAKVPGGESYQDVKQRFGEFLYEIEQKHTKETILIVTHGVGFEALGATAEGATKERSKELIQTLYAKNAEVREIMFVPIPHNEAYELDLHRPYIDELVLHSDSGQELRRVKEVMDVWFDSGAMPFATNSPYPADYIAEGLDQTRGWFYTLLAVGTLMGKGRAFKNVICLGLLLDKEGQKMSKSKGNVVEPFAELDRWGADTIRFWMYYVNQAGDSKNYDEKTLKEAARVLSWLDNSAKFYELFKTETEKKGRVAVIDVWMRARTNETIAEMTRAMDTYKPHEAVRALAALVEDMSQWYVRRIRDRVRAGDKGAHVTLRETLQVAARLLAPFAPFLAEEIYRKVRAKSEPESVHLTRWPTRHWWSLWFTSHDRNLITHMQQVRGIASRVLQLRQKANIKVRQPLAQLFVPHDMPAAFSAILADEVNVKKVQKGSELALDTTLTPELVTEGDEREFARAIAEARKTMALMPHDSVRVVKGSGPYSVELSTGTEAFDLIRNAA